MIGGTATTMTVSRTDEDKKGRPSGRLGFAAAMRRLREAQKPGYGVPAYMRWVNRPLARPLAAAAHVAGLTPNAVTGASALASSLGLITLIVFERTPVVGLAAALLLALGFALDSADGQLARLTATGGPAGEWLDHVVDAVRTPAIHITILLLTVAHFGWTPYLAVPILFCLGAVGHFMSQILAEQMRRNRGGAIVGSTYARPSRSLLLLPVDAGVLCWVFVLWGFPVLFAVAYAVLAAAQVATAVVSMRRKYTELAGLALVRGAA